MEEVTIAKYSDLEKRINSMLEELGITANLLGYHYLRDAVMICLSSGHRVSITKVVYPDVAKIYDTSPTRVERAIRHAICKAFDRLGIEVAHSYFGNIINPNTVKLTNSEFIAVLVNKLKSI